MIPHDNRYQGFKCQPYFIGLLLACSFAIFCQAHESILDAEIARNHETSAIHHAESGQQMQLIKPQEFEVHGEMGHFDEDLDAPFWHRSNEVSVGLHDGLSDEEISPDEAESPGPSVGHLLSRPQFDVRLQFGAMGDGITNDTDVCETLKMNLVLLLILQLCITLFNTWHYSPLFGMWDSNNK